MRPTSRAVAVILAATTLTASGCGKSTKTTATRTDLIAKTEAICGHARANRTRSKLVTPQDFARSLPQIAADDTVMREELDKLTPPASIAGEWRQLSANISDFTSGMMRMASYLQTNNIEAARTQYKAVGAIQNRILDILRRNHVTECIRIF